MNSNIPWVSIDLHTGGDFLGQNQSFKLPPLPVLAVSTSGHKVFGGVIIYTASVSDSSNPVTGEVAFTIAKRSICSAAVINGSASCSTASQLPAGAMIVVAKYVGASGIANAKVAMFIKPDATELVTSTTIDGTDKLLSITVTAALPGSGTPHGWIVVAAGPFHYRLVVVDSKASVVLNSHTRSVTIELHTGRDFLGQTQVIAMSGLLGQ